ncbi:hypothetical protein AXG93_909s1030 [Marchantia polymorpha subsp. ruderalis]|uniref:Uncharacterized protein n=1 Tax=Marchantia polymorpha subsp. ruderalis TaxID=1480154 RepID=A0A176VFP7_MARPO|nr:hypothetical protein AXG93_909s1030 [Marchantia polymorpha subsp. ruderalis]
MRERGSNLTDLDISEDEIGDMAPPTIAKMWKLVPLKEREILAIESSEETDEEDDVPPEEPPRRTARGLIQVDVIKEQSERRLAKRQSIIVDSEEGRRPESRMTKTQRTGIKSSKTQARPKKKANRERFVSDSLNSSVAKTDAVASTTDEEKK